MLSVSIIVPVHNGGKAFSRCLDSLTRSASDVDEIIIVADGETDGSWRRAYASGARVLVNETTRGPSAARNLGARAAAGDVLLFVDADVCLQPDTVHLVREAFAFDPDLAAVFGSYDDEPAATSFLSRYRNLLHHFTHQRSDEAARTFWCGCGAIRSEIFKGAGGFDDTYTTACVEDIELGYRLAKAGRRIRLRKDIQVKHMKQWSAAAMIRTDVFGRAIPWTELILSHREMRDDLNLRKENRLSVVLVFCLVAASLLGLHFPGMLVTAGICAAFFVVLNLPFYRLLARKQGLSFALAAIPWHALFYFYGGLGFLIGLFRFLAGRHASSVRPGAAEREAPFASLEADSSAVHGPAKV